jgi:hypothetical protein
VSYRVKSTYAASCDASEYVVDKCDKSITVDLPGTSFEAKDRMRKAGWYIGTGGTCFCPKHHNALIKTQSNG